jgi:hypothetical protein
MLEPYTHKIIVWQSYLFRREGQVSLANIDLEDLGNGEPKERRSDGNGRETHGSKCTTVV